jgi:hypothetical protein
MPAQLLPRMFRARQHFPKSPPIDLRASVRQEFAKVQARLKPGARIALAVGSRGIANLQPIVAAVLEQLKSAGAKPFIIPAMGSHGGATPQGQIEILAEYGISEALLRVPVHAAMEVERLGVTPDGVEAFCSTEALRADGIVLINRIKPHTDFSSDSLGSGLLKMLVVGLGKRAGAANYHLSSTRFGYEHVLRSIARISLSAAPVLCGLGIVENHCHDTASLTLLLPEELETREGELFRKSKRFMPALPFDDIDLLIVDRLGKNISGAGMDPNITGRWVHGYSTMLGHATQAGPAVRRLFVRDLTPETRSNAIGVGLADFTTTRLVRAMDHQVTYLNSMTSLALNCAKIPIHFDTDREAITRALASLPLTDPSQAKIIRIADTLSLETVELSAAYSDLLSTRRNLEALTAPQEMAFDPAGNLV